jgi:hypothetical protein
MSIYIVVQIIPYVIAGNKYTIYGKEKLVEGGIVLVRAY